jgi:hypothetical protein
MGEIYEIVIFTASLSKYADPVLDQLDIYKVVGDGARLFRESCYNNKGNYVKVSLPFRLIISSQPFHNTDCSLYDVHRIYLNWEDQLQSVSSSIIHLLPMFSILTTPFQFPHGSMILMIPN